MIAINEDNDSDNTKISNGKANEKKGVDGKTNGIRL